MIVRSTYVIFAQKKLMAIPTIFHYGAAYKVTARR